MAEGGGRRPRWWPFPRRRQAAEMRQLAVDWAEAPGGRTTFDDARRRAPFPRRLMFLR